MKSPITMESQAKCGSHLHSDRAEKPMRARRLSQRRPVVLLCDLDSGESSWL